MFASLIATLATYDPSDQPSVASLREQLAQVAGGSLLEEASRQRFWAEATQEDCTEVVPRLLTAYVAQRREYLRRAFASRYDVSDAFLGLHVELMLLLQDVGDHVQWCLGDIARLLLGSDQEVYFVACKMLAGSSCRRFVPTGTILNTLSKWGVCEHPFSLGKAIIKASQYDLELARSLVDAVGGDENINEAVMSIITDLPLDAQTKHARACQVAERLHPTSAFAAIRGLADIGIVTPAAVTIVKSALESKVWYIRAVAAETGGKLQMAATEIVPRLILFLHDVEGHDATVQEFAIRGLGHYGRAAREGLSELQSLREKFVADGYDSHDLEDLDAAIAHISER